jgi:hypothetical protein
MDIFFKTNILICIITSVSLIIHLEHNNKLSILIVKKKKSNTSN